MRQLLQSYKTGELRLVDVPAPAVRAGGVLVRTRASLVSAGTERMILDLARKSIVGKARERPDLVRKVLAKMKKEGVLATFAAVQSKLDQPIPLGYSCVGDVVAVGAGAEGFAAGDRLACAGASYANHAEINYVPKNLAARVPTGVSDEAAAFATVGAIAMQGVRIARVELGETVAVLGLGLIGQLAVQILRASGARVFGVDLDGQKVELARRFGAELALARQEPSLLERMQQATHGRGVDAVLIAAAAPTSDPIELAGELCRDRGRVVVVGAVKMEVPRKTYYEKELELRLSRSYGPGRYDPSYEEGGVDYPYGYVRWTEQRNLESFLGLCAAGRVDVAPLVTHRFPLARALDAYRLITEGGEPFLGVLLTYDDAPPAFGSITLPRPTQLRTDGKLGVGVVGAGGFAASVLLPAFAKAGVRFEAIASAGGVTARHLGERFGFAEAGTAVESVIARDGTDAVVIATRHHLHAPQAIAALRADKHVFVEKPLALTEEELDAVLAAQRQSGRVLTVGFNRRFSPLAVELRARLAVRAGPLAVVYRINAGPLPSHHWTRDPGVGGGRILGEVCHFVDLCRFLIGASITGADAVPLSEDGCAATLRYEDGSVASIVYATEGDPGFAKERVEVIGDRLVATIEDWRALTLSEGGRSRTRVLLLPDKGHRAEVAAFVDACRTGAPPIDYEVLAETTRATIALDRATRQGAVPFDSPLVGVAATGGVPERDEPDDRRPHDDDRAES